MTRAYRSSTTACHCRFTCPHLLAPPPAAAALSYLILSPTAPPRYSPTTHPSHMLTIQCYSGMELDFLEALKYRRRFFRPSLTSCLSPTLYAITLDLPTLSNTHAWHLLRVFDFCQKKTISYQFSINSQSKLKKDTLHFFSQIVLV